MNRSNNVFGEVSASTNTSDILSKIRDNQGFRPRLLIDTVIDFEWNFITENEKVFKEVAIYHLDTNQIQTFVIRPSVPFKNLNKKTQSLNSYLSQHLHRIRYKHGLVDCNSIDLSLKKFCRNRVVGVKGLEKSKFLAQKLGNSVFNIELLGCPSFEDLLLHNPNSTFGCLLKEHSGTFKHCAQAKAFKYGNWMKYRDNFLQSEYRLDYIKKCMDLALILPQRVSLDNSVHYE